MIIKILFSDKADVSFLQTHMPLFAKQGEAFNLLKRFDGESDDTFEMIYNQFKSGEFIDIQNVEQPRKMFPAIKFHIREHLHLYFRGVLKHNGLINSRTDLLNAEISFVTEIPDKNEHGKAFYWHQASDTLVNQ